MKASWGQVNGQAREMFKDPVTDNGGKQSARGLLLVEATADGFELFDQQSPEQERQGALQTVFEDGCLLAEQNLADIRLRLDSKTRHRQASQ